MRPWPLLYIMLHLKQLNLEAENMRIVRYETQDGKKPKYGWLLGDKVGEIGGSIFGRYRRKEAQTPLTDVRLVAPSEPSKIICVGRNYVEHAKELGNEVP